MDEEAQDRIFDRLQEKFDVEDITPEQVTEFLRWDKPNEVRNYTWEEHVWRGGKVTDKLRRMNRDYKTKDWSSEKQVIVDNLGGLSEIVKKIPELKGDERGLGNLKVIKEDYESFKSGVLSVKKSVDEKINNDFDSVEEVLVSERVEDLSSRAKTTSAFRVALRFAETREQQENILVDAREALGDGKNFQSLVDGLK